MQQQQREIRSGRLDTAASARRADLDGLRALAILPVLLFHSGYETFSGGFVGVDVFFVLSGYLITGLILRDVERRTFSFKAFYVRRLRRLFPALFVTIAATLAAGFFILAPHHYEGLGWSAVAALFSVSNITFWNESGYFGVDGIFKPLLHTWSLGVEEQFYLVWPALLVSAVALTRRWTRPRTAALILLALLGTAALLAQELTVDRNRETPFFLMPFRITEFALGGLCLAARRHVTLPRLAFDLLFVAGLALVLVAVFSFSETTRFPGVSQLVPAGGAALLIVAGDRSRLSPVLTSPLVVWIGVISYSLYLVHWPVGVFWAYGAGGELQGLDRIGVVGLSLALGAALHLLVEKPLRMRPGESDDDRKSLVPAISLAGVLVACLAAGIVYGGGLAWRARIDPALVGFDAKALHKATFGGRPCRKQPCFYGAPKAPIGLLVAGDSHGHQYASGLEALLAPLGIGIAGYHDGSCAFFTEDQILGQRAKDDCVPMKAALRRAMASNTTPIFLGQSWPLYRKFQSRDGRALPMASDQLQSYVQASLEDFLKSIGPERPIVLMGAVPGAGKGKIDTLTCLSRPQLLAALGLGPAVQPTVECATTQRVDGEGQKLNRWIREAAGRFPNVTFLDPFDALCKGDVCLSIWDNKLLYSDDAHLSLTGSAFVISHFRHEILKALQLPDRPST